MWKALMWLQKNLTWSIPLSMLAGLVFGQLKRGAIFAP